MCQAFSGNFAGVELRLDADGTLTAPVNDKSFEQISPGTTGERVQIFPGDADARSLTAPPSYWSLLDLCGPKLTNKRLTRHVMQFVASESPVHCTQGEGDGKRGPATRRSPRRRVMP